MLSSSLFSVWHLLCCLHFCKPLVTILFPLLTLRKKHCMTQSNYGSSCLRCLIFKVLFASFKLISFQVALLLYHIEFSLSTLFWNLFFVFFSIPIEIYWKTTLNLIFCCCSLWQLDYYIKSSLTCQHLFSSFWSYFFALACTNQSQPNANSTSNYQLVFSVFNCRFDSFVIISFLFAFVNRFLQVF